MTDEARIERSVLPIPDAQHVGVTTYDAKDPSTSYPPIVPLRPPAGAPNVSDHPDRRCRFRLLERLRGPCVTPTFERLAAEWSAFHPVSHHRPVLAHPGRAAHRTQPSLGGDGRDHRDRHLGPRVQLAAAQEQGTAWRRRSSSTGTPPPTLASATRCLSGRRARWVPSTAGRHLATASSTSTGSSVVRPTSTPLPSTGTRCRLSRIAPPRRATTSPRT